MALNPWTRELGTTQGRIQPSGWSPTQGDYVFCLGRDLPGLFHTFAIGDKAELSQTADFGTTKLVRLRTRLRPPAEETAGVVWLFSILIDGTELVSQILEPGRRRDRDDFVLNVANLAPGDHTLTFRLSLVAA